MNFRYIKLTIIILIVIFQNLQAQNKLFIKKRSGILNALLIEDIRKIKFSNGNLELSYWDISKTNLSLNEIRYISFINYDIQNTLSLRKESTNINIFPNPVVEKLQLQYTANENKDVYIEIIDLKGHLYFQKRMNAVKGYNNISIQCNNFPLGILVIRLRKSDEIEMAKFIKL